MIGDPTGKKVTRPPLTHEEILANAKTYERQVFKILDPQKTETRFNNEWLGQLGSAGMGNLRAKNTVAPQVHRRCFKKHLDSAPPLSPPHLLLPPPPTTP